MENSTYTTPGTTGNGSSGMPDMGQVKQQAGQMAGQWMDQARGQISTQLDSQKSRAAESLTGVAQALRSTSQQLRTENQEPIAHVAEQAAGVVDNVSTYLRDARLEDMTMEVENFARRQPALFLGGAFALGFLASRFLKSSGGGYSSYNSSYGRQNYVAGQDMQTTTYGGEYGSGTYAGGSASGSTLPTAYDRALDNTPPVSGAGATFGSGTSTDVVSSSAMGDAYDMEDTDELTGTSTGSTGSAGSIE